MRPATLFAIPQPLLHDPHHCTVDPGRAQYRMLKIKAKLNFSIKRSIAPTGFKILDLQAN